MSAEYKLSYTGAQIDEILKKAEGLKNLSQLTNDSGYVKKSELEAMVVMAIDNPDTGETHTNYSSKEIHDAYRAGRTVLMNINGVLGYLTNITPNGGVVQFTFSHEDTKFVVAIDGNEVVNEIVYDTKLTPFIVTLDGSTNTTDKSVVEMYEVWTKGRQIYLDINGMLIPLTSFGDNMAVFTLCIEGAQILFTVDGNKVSEEVFEMALSEDIPTDEHINELIDAKLPDDDGNEAVEPLLLQMQTHGDEYTVDKPFDDIVAAILECRDVYLIVSNHTILPLSVFDEGDLLAQFDYNAGEALVKFTVARDSTVLTTVHEYAKVEDIPTDEHINGLINTKLEGFDVPAGGSSSEEWVVLADATFNEGTVSYSITELPGGKPWSSIRKLFIDGKAVRDADGVGGYDGVCIHNNNNPGGSYLCGKQTTAGYNCFWAMLERVDDFLVSTNIMSDVNNGYHIKVYKTSYSDVRGIQLKFTDIECIVFKGYSGGTIFGPGSTLKVYAVLD